MEKGAVKSFLEAKFGKTIVYAVVFGSHLYGTATRDSDLDLYVVVNDRLALGDVITYPEERIDVTLVSEPFFEEMLKDNDVKAIEALFVPNEFIIFEKQKDFLFVPEGPKMRRTYGAVCRKAWDRGVKKLTREKETTEHEIGKKSLFHAIRFFICACLLSDSATGSFSFNDSALLEAKDFYEHIRYKSAEELTEGGNLKREYVDLYKKHDRLFKQKVKK